MNVKGKMGTLAWAVIVIAILGVGAIMTGYIDTSQFFAVTPATQMPERQFIEGCDSTTTPELDLVGLDAINQATTRTNDLNVAVFINGTFKEDVDLEVDSTVDVSPGDGYALFAHPTANNIDYIGAIATGNVPCEELTTINFMIPATGTMTTTFFNDDDGLQNKDTDQQAVGSGETVSIDFELKESTADQCIGNETSTLDLRLCVDYNSTSFKQPVFKMDGASVGTVGVPEGHTNIRWSALDSTVCYDLEGTKAICDYQKVDGLSLQIEAKSGVDPSADSGVNSDDMNTWVYMPQVFQNSETGDYDWMYSNPVDANAIIFPRSGGLIFS